MEAASSLIGLKFLSVVAVGTETRTGAPGSKSQSEGRNNGALPPAEGEIINWTVSTWNRNLNVNHSFVAENEATKDLKSGIITTSYISSHCQHFLDL